MKAVRYIFAILVVLAIAVGGVFYFREPVAQFAANTALRDSGVTVSEISIEALRLDRVVISNLVLYLDDGTQLSLSGLDYRRDWSGNEPASISIEAAALVRTAYDAPPPAPTILLQAFLNLPELAPEIDIGISRLDLAGMPELSDVGWNSRSGRQELSFVFEDLAISGSISRANEERHDASIKVDTDDHPESLVLAVGIVPNAVGYTLDGVVSIALAPWLQVLQSRGVLARNLASIDAQLKGPISVSLYEDVSEPSAANLELSLTGPLAARYEMPDGTRFAARAITPDPIGLGITYPGLDWFARARQVDLTVALEDGGMEIPLHVGDIQCRAGVACALTLDVTAGPLRYASTTVGRGTARASLAVARDEVTRVEIAPDLEFNLSSIDAEGFSISKVTGGEFSGAQFVLDDAGWRGDVGRLGLVLNDVVAGDELRMDLPVTVSNLRIRDSGDVLDADVELAASTLPWQMLPVLLPAISGQVSLEGNRIAATGTISDDSGGLSARLVASHDLDAGSGSLSLPEVSLDFDRRKLSAISADWPFAWDIVSGSGTAIGSVDWRSTGTGDLHLAGSASLSANSLAGIYRDSGFVGFATSLEARFDSDRGLSVSPATASLAMVEFGIPVRDISADYLFDMDSQSVQVENLTMSVLGGRLAADPFRLGLEAEPLDMLLRLHSIQLQFILALAKFEDIELSGSISGVIPLLIEGDTVTITEGKLQSDAPGGVIRYRSAADSDDSALNLVSRALSNFRFDSLTSEVTYTAEGDLKQQMRLTGINPDLDDRQPVILNLGVENNIPSMLRSLQATRAIEDIIERATKNQKRP